MKKSAPISKSIEKKTIIRQVWMSGEKLLKEKGDLISCIPLFSFEAADGTSSCGGLALEDDEHHCGIKGIASHYASLFKIVVIGDYKVVKGQSSMPAILLKEELTRLGVQVLSNFYSVQVKKGDRVETERRKWNCMRADFKKWFEKGLFLVNAEK